MRSSVSKCPTPGLVSESILTGNDFLRSLKVLRFLPERWNTPDAARMPKRIGNQPFLPDVSIGTPTYVRRMPVTLTPLPMSRLWS